MLILYSEYRYAAIRSGDRLEVDNWDFLLIRSSIIVSRMDIALSLVIVRGVRESQRFSTSKIEGIKYSSRLSSYII